jgi:hypothetical protein
LTPTCALPLNQAGDQIQPDFVSSHRRLDIFFYSDASMELAGGFQAEYRAIKADCGGALLAGTEWGNISYSSEKTLTRTNQRHKR